VDPLLGTDFGSIGFGNFKAGGGKTDYGLSRIHSFSKKGGCKGGNLPIQTGRGILLNLIVAGIKVAKGLKGLTFLEN